MSWSDCDVLKPVTNGRDDGNLTSTLPDTFMDLSAVSDGIQPSHTTRADCNVPKPVTGGMDEPNLTSALPEIDEIHPSHTRRAVVLFVGFLLVTISCGITHSYGVLLVAFIQDLGIQPVQASWVAGVEQFLYYFTGMLVLPFVERLGWQLSAFLGTLSAATGLLLSSFIPNFNYMYITFGLLTGVGLGVHLLLAFIVAENYMEHHMKIALAVVATGYEAGLMIFGPLMQYFLDQLGWRWALRATSLVSLLCLLGVLAYQPLPKTNTKTKYSLRTALSLTLTVFKIDKADTETIISEDTTKQTKQCSCFKGLLVRFKQMWLFYGTLDVLLFGTAFFCFAWSYDEPFTFLSLRAQTHGITGDRAATLLTIFGASGICIRMLVLATNFKNFKLNIIINCMAMFLAGSASLFVPLCTDYSRLAIYAAFIGSNLAYVSSNDIYIVSNMVGLENKEQITAAVNGFAAIADIVASPISGKLLGSTDNYDTPFLMAGSVGVLGSLIFMIASIRKRKHIANHSDHTKDKKPDLDTNSSNQDNVAECTVEYSSSKQDGVQINNGETITVWSTQL